MAPGWPPPGALLLLVVLWSVTGCGLPGRRPELYPPTNPTAYNNLRAFSFQEPALIPDAFLGYEVYYRFFATARADKPRVQSVDELLSSNFVRLAGEGDSDGRVTRPLIRPRPVRGEHEVTLSFDDVGGSVDPVAEGDVMDRISLRRGIPNEDGEFKTFDCETFKGPEDDLAAEAFGDIDAKRKVELQIYAASFGRTPTGEALWSDALPLDSIVLSVCSL